MRRRVVSSKHLNGHVWQIRFVCTLECGHATHANGRYDRSGPVTHSVPPKTVSCHKCSKQPTKGEGVA